MWYEGGGRKWVANDERVLTHGGALGTYPPLEGVRDPWGSEHAELCEAERALPVVETFDII